MSNEQILTKSTEQVYAAAVQTPMLLSSTFAGVCFTWMPDIGKAKHTATSLQRLLAHKSAIDPSSLGGSDFGTISSDIEFNSVSFAYPSCPEHLVLDKLSLRIHAGANIAFVGATDAGKSTILSFIERFYNPTGEHIVLVPNQQKNCVSQPIEIVWRLSIRSCISFPEP